jgi:serine/threonine protein kinase
MGPFPLCGWSRTICKYNGILFLIKPTAIDRRNHYVAVKILIADPDASKHELAILQVLSRSSVQGKSHVMNMLDFFEHKGPNGVHRCLVFELMGPSVASASEDLLNDVLDASSEQQRFPIWMVKRILHHTLLGIEFLHANGIAHGDLQQANLLFPVKDLSTVGEEELSRNDEISEPVRRLDGRTDLWAPKYLALDQPLSQYIDASPGLNIKISDLGGGMFPIILYLKFCAFKYNSWRCPESRTSCSFLPVRPS